MLLAIVGVAVLIVAIVALRDPKNPATHDAAATSSSTTRASSSSSARSTSSAPATDTSTASQLSAAQLKSRIPLVVLNNTTITGLAAQAAQRFEQGGWKVTDTGNLVNNIISTCAYYDPHAHHAKAAAEELRSEYPTIQRVEPKFAGLVAGPVVVVLTPGYSAD